MRMKAIAIPVLERLKGLIILVSLIKFSNIYDNYSLNYLKYQTCDKDSACPSFLGLSENHPP
jgi:hypothetical protein